MTTESPMPASLFIERILSVITVLGVICLCIGIPLHVWGRISDSFPAAQVGAYIFLFGFLLIFMRVFYWILEKIVERG